MMGLNNKGMTIVEILVCFMIVTFISVSLFNTVETFNNKKSIESAKSALLEYRNNIDKMIEDDLIHRGLTNVQITDNHNPDADKFYKDVKLFFRDGSTKTLRINDQRAGEYYYNLEGQSAVTEEKDAACTGYDDEFFIQYGSVFSGASADYIEYVLPDVGQYENTECPTKNGDHHPEIIKDIRFGKIDVSAKDNVLVIYIGFTHPELGNDYAINIVAPINYYA